MHKDNKKIETKNEKKQETRNERKATKNGG